MRINVLTGFLILIALLVPHAAISQERAEYEQLASAGFSRAFGTATVATDFVIRADGNFAPGQRAYLQIDLNTNLDAASDYMPRAVVINGFVTVALPPGLEPDGQPRLMYFDAAKDRYEYLYSKTYPRLERFDGLSSAIEDTTSGSPAQMLLGLDAIVGVLDPKVFLTPPSDPRLIGRDQSYAITGVSWLIPCNVMFNELVGLFDPDTGMASTADLRVSIPLKTTAPLADSTLVVYAGGLSSAVDLVSLLPADIPPTAIPLAPVTSPPVSDEPVADDDTGAEPSADIDSKTAPRKIVPGADFQDEIPATGDQPRDTGDYQAPPPPPQPVPTLIYSHEWLHWETEVDLQALLPAPELPVDIPIPSRAPDPLLPQDPTELIGQPRHETPPDVQPAAEPTSQPAPVDPEPESPAPVLPPTSVVESEPQTASPESIDPPASFTPTPQDSTTVRQVEPGTLPEQIESYTVPLKPITGSGAGSRPTQASANAGSDTRNAEPPAYPSADTTSPPPGLGEMITIPEGYFLMGTAANSSAGDADEMPQTQVYLPAYQIDKYPVTNRDFYSFVISAGYKPAGNWEKYYSPGTADLPVRGVTWDDATAFAKWAGKRLPTEAEWEKAARGDDGRTYPWGEDWSSEILPRGEYLYDIMTARSAASPYGVLGMSGLVWQWTASALHPYPFNPDARGDERVLRGGAFSNGRNIVRCANRYSESANVALNTFSFRCARDVP